MPPGSFATARGGRQMRVKSSSHICAHCRPVRCAAVLQRTAWPRLRPHREQRIASSFSPCASRHSHGSTNGPVTKHSPPSDQVPSPETPAPDHACSSPHATGWRVSRRASGFAAVSAAYSLLWQRAQPAAASNVTLPQQQRPSVPGPRQQQRQQEEPIPVQVAHVRQLTQQAEHAADVGDYQQVCRPRPVCQAQLHMTALGPPDEAADVAFR